MEKKEKLKAKINEYVNTAVDKADTDGSIEHFEIEIKVHQKDIRVNTLTKKIGKLY